MQILAGEYSSSRQLADVRAIDASAAPAVQADLRAILAKHPLEPDMRSEVAEATRKEIEAGWVTGPFTEAEVRWLSLHSGLPNNRVGPQD